MCVCVCLWGLFRCFLAVEELRKSIKVEVWVIPYARYELGMLWLRQVLIFKKGRFAQIR